MSIAKAFGYARKSPDDKKDMQTSISNQISLIESTCKEKQWELIKIFTDNNISGGDRERKEFSKMINEVMDYKIKNPGFEVYIVVKEQDRFARDASFFLDTIKNLEVRNVNVFSILKNDFLSHEDLADAVTALIDGYYLITQRRKTKSLFKQKMEQGLPPIRAPFGYKNKKGLGWTVSKPRAKIVVEVCNDFVNKINFRETLKRLKLNKNLYYRIIANFKKGLYNGYICYENKLRDSNKHVIKIEEIKYLGKHEPLINENLWNKIK